jgi:ABC-type multidrug transport system fused ATPase/permease subunit
MVKNIRTWILFIISLIVFMSASFLLPTLKVNSNLLSLSLTATSILFGLLSGFFISELWKKYSTIRRLNSKFVSNLESLILNFKSLSGNEDLKQEFKDKVHTYLIVYNLLPWNEMNHGDEYFSRVIKIPRKSTINSEKDEVIFEQLLEQSSSVSSIREELSIVGKERLFKLEWMVLGSLSSVIIVSAYMLRDGSLFFNIIAALLSSVVVLTLAILDDLNNLRWNATEVSFAPVQSLFKSIEKKEFYEKKYIEAGLAQPSSEEYLTEEDLNGEKREIYEKFKKEGYLGSSSILGYEI